MTNWRFNKVRERLKIVKYAVTFMSTESLFLSKRSETNKAKATPNIVKSFALSTRSVWFLVVEREVTSR